MPRVHKRKITTNVALCERIKDFIEISKVTFFQNSMGRGQSKYENPKQMQFTLESLLPHLKNGSYN